MRAAAAVLIVGTVLAGQPASAETVISYSAPENIYGWCAGYASARAQRCAQTNCAKYGGSSCQPVVECRSGCGWNGAEVV